MSLRLPALTALIALFAALVAFALDGPTAGAQTSVTLTAFGSCTPTHECPHIPTNGTATPGDGQIIIRWTPASTGPSASISLVQWRRSGTSNFQNKEVLTTATSYVIDGLSNSEEYDVRVRHGRQLGQDGSKRWGRALGANNVQPMGDQPEAGVTVNTPVSSTTLVSNLDQTLSSNFTHFGRDLAQAFTTGGHRAGYTLTRLQVGFGVQNPSNTDKSTYTVGVYSGTSTKPDLDDLRGELTRSTLLQAGVNTFTASGDGIRLNAATTYWVVVDVSSFTNRNPRYTHTDTGGEDPTSAMGWTIADGFLDRSYNTTADSWSEVDDHALRMSLHGCVGSCPSTTLVSNTGQPDDSTADLEADRAVAFRTGAFTGGYVLNSVKLDFTVTTPSGTQPTYTAGIFDDSSGNPNQKRATLFTPGSLQDGLNEFTLPDPLMLDPETTYHVFLTVTATGTNGAVLNMTESDGEDVARAGWSINDGYVFRARGGGAWQTDSTRTPQMSVHGHHIPAPVVRSATVEFSALEITFDRALDEDSVPATGAFTVTASDGTTISVSGVDVSGDTVTLTLASSVLPGETVTVSYTPPASNPLQDTLDIDVTQFENRRVTTNTPRDAEFGVIYEAPPPEGVYRVDHRVWRAEDGHCYLEQRNTSTLLWSRSASYGPTAEDCRLAAWHAYQSSRGEELTSRDSEIRADHPLNLSDFTCPSGWEGSTDYGQQWCSVGIGGGEAAIIALSPERAREFLRLGLRTSDYQSDNELRWNNFFFFVYGPGCDENYEYRYTFIAGELSCDYPEFPDVQPGQGTSATDRRVPADSVAIPLEVVKGYYYSEKHGQTIYGALQNEDGTTKTRPRENPDAPCDGKYWDEDIRQWVCS